MVNGGLTVNKLQNCNNPLQHAVVKKLKRWTNLKIAITPANLID